MDEAKYLNEFVVNNRLVKYLYLLMVSKKKLACVYDNDGKNIHLNFYFCKILVGRFYFKHHVLTVRFYCFLWLNDRIINCSRKSLLMELEWS